MRAVVFAYHNIGVIGIEKLISAGFEIPLVITHEDAPGENIWFSSVAELCRRRSLSHAAPGDPNTQELFDTIEENKPDIIFSFYYRSLIARRILDIPPLGAYNLHGSYLPWYRGRCPVNWVIINGERYTGVTLHQMIEKPDAGDIVAQQKVEISPDDTAFSLFHKIESASGELLDQILPVIRSGRIPRKPQDVSRGSYYGGRRPEDGHIDWKKSAREIRNLIRGVTRPYPGAFGLLAGRKAIIWRASGDDGHELSPGMIGIRAGKALIGTGTGCLVPEELELDGSLFTGRELFSLLSEMEGEQFT